MRTLIFSFIDYLLHPRSLLRAGSLLHARFLLHSNKRLSASFVFSILLLIFSASVSGTPINAYAKVTAISGTTLTLSNYTKTYHTFSNGEQIIIMQMQDNVIGANTSNTAGFGAVSTIAQAGLFEVATIQSVTGLPGSITITSPLTNTYIIGTNSSVQIISFNNLSSTNYTLSTALTAVAWNGKIGGVVALQVGGTLTLSNSIIVDGQGFRGGLVSSAYESSCEPNVYISNSSNYANKGESIYLNTNSNYKYGRAPILNGGGGGSDDNGGGGGGSNFTEGGLGGEGWTCTPADASGGMGGVSLGSYALPSRIFMGGGGGGGQQNNNVGTPGTNGGGIIILKAATLNTSCPDSVILSANGIPGTTSGNDGAGGAGGGGSIVLQVTNFNVSASCPLTVKSNGGDGGNVGDPNSHGGGGGGGQGLIIYSVALPSSNIVSTTKNGIGGLNSSSVGASSAGRGAGSDNSGILGGNMTPLPIGLLSFTATNKGNGINLAWTVDLSVQQAAFQVQHSTDGEHFTVIGTVDYNNSTSGNYSFTDYNPYSGKNFYRLKELPLSGNSSYSSMITILTIPTETKLDVYPNPTLQQFTIRFSGISDRIWAITITDLEGHIVYANAVLSLNNRIQVENNKILTPGLYIIKLGSNERTLFGKLLIK